MIIDLGEASYPVYIENNSISALFATNYGESFNGLIVVDKIIHELLRQTNEGYIALDPSHIIVLEAGKQSKTMLALNNILSRLDDKNMSRDGTLVAIGGGVIGDVAGLAASLWYRGCKLVHVPTTLLSAVDSCVGGKTAINYNKTINAIGTYYHPEAIYIDLLLLKSLPRREINSGLAEVVKYCVLGNQELTDLMQGLNFENDISSDVLKKIIKLSIEQKARFVRGDIRESNKRLFLNLGHTLGHSIEINTIFDGEERLRHGEGVALGLAGISHISRKLKKLSEEQLQEILVLIKRVGLPTSYPASDVRLTREALIDRCTTSTFRDKKRVKETLRLIVPQKFGECEIYPTSSRALIQYGLGKIIHG